MPFLVFLRNIALVFAGFTGLMYGTLTWVGEPCKHRVIITAKVTITDDVGRVISTSPITVFVCEPTK